MYRIFFKRLIDILVSVTALIILCPVFLFVMIGLAFANEGKPFFFQQRPGKNGRIFSIIKFKTMNDKKDAHGNLLSDVERLTPVGDFVRKTSLDEIPQLINVIKGDMSLIGPRPLLPKDLSLYNDFQSRRHEVKPGITGWAQVNGRNSIAWEKKFEHDVWYVDHMNLGFDMKIIFLTIKKVIKSEGITQDNHATAGEFKGTK